MSPLRRIWNLLRRSRLDDEMQQELETHLALIEAAARIVLHERVEEITT